MFRVGSCFWTLRRGPGGQQKEFFGGKSVKCKDWSYRTLSGIERITKERIRQIKKEGWTAEHDDEHTDDSLALVAALYATPVLLYRMETDYVNRVTFVDPWPESWDEEWDKRPHPGQGNVIGANEKLSVTKRIRQLEKAGALIAAEIDRLERTQTANGDSKSEGT